jgi:hypothetical protein
LTAALFSSCYDSSKSVLEENLYFSLLPGNLEDQINFFGSSGGYHSSESIATKDGRYYIGNGKSNKLMDFNSYGDLLNIYYNPEDNPAPILLSRFSDSEQVSNRNAFEYSFNKMGSFAVNSNHELYIADRVLSGREEYSEDGSVFSVRLLHFDNQGEAVDYIGQNGLGGTPFSSIDSVSISKSNEISVVSKQKDLFKYYLYSPAGKLLYDVSLNAQGLPASYDKEKDTFAVIDYVVPDREKRLFYVKVDYYNGMISNDSSSQYSGVSFKLSSIWRYDLVKGEFTGGHIDLPEVFVKNSVIGGPGSEAREVVYDFLGCDESGNLFLLCLTQKNVYNLRIYSRNGKLLLDKTLLLNDTETYHRFFSISDNGRLIAMIAYEDRIDIAGWNTDKLLKSLIRRK